MAERERQKAEQLAELRRKSQQNSERIRKKYEEEKNSMNHKNGLNALNAPNQAVNQRLSRNAMMGNLSRKQKGQ